MVVVDHEAGPLVWAAAGHDKATLQQFRSGRLRRNRRRVTAGSSCTLGDTEVQVLIGEDIDDAAFKEAQRGYLECDVPGMSKWARAAGGGWRVDVHGMGGPSKAVAAAEDLVDRLGTRAVDTVAC